MLQDSEGELADVPDAEAAGGGLEVQLHDGKRARLPPALAAGSLIVMLGDGWHQWINPGLRSPLRPAPHAMTMPRLAAAAAADAAAPQPLRLWYGRMFLPPLDALLPPHGISFERVRAAWRQEATAAPRRRLRAATAAAAAATGLAAVEDGDEHGEEEEEEEEEGVLPVGCAGGARRELVDNDSCFANQARLDCQKARATQAPTRLAQAPTPVPAAALALATALVPTVA